jgi:hypothetical protein
MLSCQERCTVCYFLRLITRPGSAEFVEIKFPCPSRVVWNRSLVRPVIPLSSFRTTAEVSLKPVARIIHKEWSGVRLFA